MDQALNSHKTPHTSPLRASYGMSFVSILMKNDRVIKGFYCISCIWLNLVQNNIHGMTSPFMFLVVKMGEYLYLSSSRF